MGGQGKKKVFVPQKNYRWSKQLINQIIGSPTLADAKAISLEIWENHVTITVY